jgi:hypothetical protein
MNKPKTMTKMASLAAQAHLTLKKPSVLQDIITLRAMRKEMKEKCGETVSSDIEATDRIIEYITSPDDRTLANMYLLIVGASLILLGVVVGAVGAYHAFHAHPEAKIIGVYAAGFMVFGWTSLLGVRR